MQSQGTFQPWDPPARATITLAAAGRGPSERRCSALGVRSCRPTRQIASLPNRQNFLHKKCESGQKSAKLTIVWGRSRTKGHRSRTSCSGLLCSVCGTTERPRWIRFRRPAPRSSSRPASLCLALLCRSELGPWLSPRIIRGGPIWPQGSACVSRSRSEPSKRKVMAAARWRTTLLMNLASIVERADEQVLPAVYYFVGRSLRATPAQLGTLTFARALVQVHTSSP